MLYNEECCEREGNGGARESTENGNKLVQLIAQTHSEQYHQEQQNAPRNILTNLSFA